MATVPADSTVPCPARTSAQRRSSFQPMSIKRPSPAWTGPDAVHTVLPAAALPIPAQSRRGIIQPLRCRTTCALVLRQDIHHADTPSSQLPGCFQATGGNQRSHPSHPEKPSRKAAAFSAFRVGRYSYSTTGDFASPLVRYSHI